MNFPLQLRFKLFSLTSQISVTDAEGKTVFYIKEKMFKLRETIAVFADEDQKQQVAGIRANSMMNWSARYEITDATGQPLGAVGRQGFRSLWRAHYDLFNAQGDRAGTIREENPFAKVLDGFIAEIPVIGMVSGSVFRPRYLLTGPDGTPVMRLHKKMAFFEGRFEIERLMETNPEVTTRDVLSLLMMVLLERRRG